MNKSVKLFRTFSRLQICSFCNPAGNTRSFCSQSIDNRISEANGKPDVDVSVTQYNQALSYAKVFISIGQPVPLASVSIIHFRGGSRIFSRGRFSETFF